VVWHCDQAVAFGHFLEAFEPIDGLSFVESGETVRDWAVHVAAPATWIREHRLLRPVPVVAKEIARHRDALGWPYSAIHVRRTDYVPHEAGHHGRLEPESAFVVWALEQQGDVHVATDNGETQIALLGALKGRGRVLVPLGGGRVQAVGDTRRHGTIADAAADLFVCASASAFLGTRGSSFSETIDRLRAVRGC
jgi:hypothetical protein